MNLLREYKADQQIAKAVEFGPIHILLADDHPMMRRALVAFLETQEDLKVVGQAANGRQAVQLAKDLKPHVVLMDVSMPEMNGLDATVYIRNDFPDTRVIGLSSHNDSQIEKTMLNAGASEYITKSDIYDKLVDAIHRVHQGGAKQGLCPSLAGNT